MSLISDLNRHEESPSRMWGRYSSSSSSSSGNVVESPSKNDVINLVHVSPPRGLLTQRSLGKNKQIEIHDDTNEQVQSNQRKISEDFSTRASNFTIPRLKTRGIDGKWPRAPGKQRKIPTQLEIMSTSEQKSPKQSTSSSVECSGKYKRFLHGSPVRGRQERKNCILVNSSSPKATSTISEGNSKITTTQNGSTRLLKPILPLKRGSDGRFVSKRSSLRSLKSRCKNTTLDEDSTTTICSSPVEEKRCDLCNDVITGGECEICPKSSEDAFELHSVPNTSEENMESSEESCLIKDEEDLENNIDDKNDEQCKDNAYHSNLIQDDLFCVFCGKAKSRNGCGCFSQQKTLTIPSKGFYPNSRRTHLNYSVIKYDPRISVKRKQQLSKKVKKSAEKKSKKSVDNNGEVDNPVEKPEKIPSPQEPEFVQISSDEDELDPSILEQSHEDEDDIEAESDDVLKQLKSSEKSEKMAKPVKKIAQKGKKIKDDCTLYEDTDASSIHLKLDRVFFGELDCEPQEPVEFLEDRMIIKVIYESKPLFFLLDKREIATFKIHVENEPYVILLTITPGCAAKFNSRYKEYGDYIWPSDRCYRQKYIVFHLKNAIDGPPLESLVEKVNLNLRGNVETISQEEAEAEMKRIRESFDEETTKPTCKPEFVSTSSSQKMKIVRTPPKFKTYSTRSKKAEAELSQTLPSRTPKTILVYQSSSKTSGSFTITSNDKLCLEPDVYLNDVIIDFYLNYLINEKLSQQDRERVHLFSTYFYLRLTQKFTDNSAEVGSPSNMHRLVKSWTKNVDIFSKDFIAIPMNESSHWFLTIICFPRMVVQKMEDNLEETVVQEEPTEERCQGSEETKDSDLDDFELKCTPPKTKSKCGRKRKSKEVLPRKEWPCILIFDSLGSHRRAKAMSNLRNYLNCEWRERKDSSAGDIFNTQSMKGSYPKVPLQFNFSDCGLYVLQYFESFFANPVKDYRPPINLQSWFTQETMENKRTDILNVIQKLADETKQLKSL